MVILEWSEPNLSHKTRGKGSFRIVCEDHGEIPFQAHTGPYQAWKRHVSEHSQPEKVAIGNAMAKSARRGYPISHVQLGSRDPNVPDDAWKLDPPPF